MDESLIFVNIKTFVKMSDFSLSLVSLSKHDNFFFVFFPPGVFPHPYSDQTPPPTLRLGRFT